MTLILLKFLLYNILFFDTITHSKYLHLSSASGCIGNCWSPIYTHSACFFKIVQNFLLRLGIYTSWFRIKSFCYPKSCFLFLQSIYCVFPTYLLIFIFAVHGIHIEQIEAVSCRLSPLNAHQSLKITIIIPNKRRIKVFKLKLFSHTQSFLSLKLQ